MIQQNWFSASLVTDGRRRKFKGLFYHKHAKVISVWHCFHSCCKATSNGSSLTSHSKNIVLFGWHYCNLWNWLKKHLRNLKGISECLEEYGLQANHAQGKFFRTSWLFIVDVLLCMHKAYINLNVCGVRSTCKSSWAKILMLKVIPLKPFPSTPFHHVAGSQMY